jgi:ABC-2 type transport system permease protein
MSAIFRHSLARSRGAILGWGISLGVLAGYLVAFYDTIAGQAEQLQQLIQAYPPELWAFFGDVATFMTPEGYLNVEFFSYMPLIIGIFAVLMGSGLLAADEESGLMDLLLAYPVSRSRFFVGRLLAFLASLVGILGLTWIGFLVGIANSTLDVPAGEMVLPFISLGAILLVFGGFSLLMSMLVPSRRLAAMLGGLVLVASFFLTSLARIDENLEAAAKLSPLNYYQGGEAINGLNGEWTIGLLGAAIILVALAWWRFLRRDIRVGGEGSWRVWVSRRRRREPVEA